LNPAISRTSKKKSSSSPAGVRKKVKNTHRTYVAPLKDQCKGEKETSIKKTKGEGGTVGDEMNILVGGGGISYNT